MLEGVLKDMRKEDDRLVVDSFNPGSVGGGVKRPLTLREISQRPGFNPWYVGGGVKRQILS